MVKYDIRFGKNQDNHTRSLPLSRPVGATRIVPMRSSRDFIRLNNYYALTPPSQEALTMKIATRGRYGLRTMLDLANHGADDAPVYLSDIAKREGISEKYLEHIFAALHKSGLVKALRGRGDCVKLRL